MYLPSSAKTSLLILGESIRVARKRRAWTIADLASKMDVSAPTVIALEKGRSTVSLGVLCSALWMLGLDQELQKLASSQDPKGIAIANSRLPKRVRAKRKLDNDF